jgi:hypothetical protein
MESVKAGAGRCAVVYNIAHMRNYERIEVLAAIAKTLTHLPFPDQYRILFAHGLTPPDINWENCASYPGMDTSFFPQRGEPKLPPAPTR